MSTLSVPVKVSRADIRDGVAGSSRGCVVARAINRAVRRYHFYATIGTLTFTLHEMGRPYQRYQHQRALPIEAQNIVRLFDAGRRDELEPASFEIELPEEAIE